MATWTAMYLVVAQQVYMCHVLSTLMAIRRNVTMSVDLAIKALQVEAVGRGLLQRWKLVVHGKMLSVNQVTGA
ncbi:hypothetical protein D3C72_1077650 [compost metagenome]